MRASLRILLPLVAACVVLGAPAARAAGTWSWPVIGPVIRGFDPPDSPYGAGHRGIDIAAPIGTDIRAAAPGVVTFAGRVGGDLFVTLDHGGRLASTYSWLSTAVVRKGDLVPQGAVIAISGQGHVGVTPSHLHFGAKLAGEYVDPMDYLAPASVVGFVRLAPLTGPG